MGSAARPLPTMTAVGVARPNAQGHATTSTATAEDIPRDQSWALNPQPTSVTAAITNTTGTNHPTTRSANRCTSVFDCCACSTSAAT